MSNLAIKNDEFQPKGGDRFADLPMDLYHGGPGISKSGLSLIGKSPLHYWSAYLDPEREPRKETTSQKIGSAIHCLILEPHLFYELYVHEQKFDRRSKKGKAEYDKWMEENDGKTILTLDEVKQIEGAAKAVSNHKLANSFCSTGTPEESFYWIDEETGVLCKCRPDNNRNDILVDIKTTHTASYQEFAKTCFNFDYHVSAAMSSEGYEKVTGVTPKAYVFVVVETKPPHAVATYVMDEQSLELGKTVYRRELNTYAKCLKENKFPGYAEGTNVLSLPPWAFTREKNEDDNND